VNSAKATAKLVAEDVFGTREIPAMTAGSELHA
jgi:hypothetical protein